MYNTTHKILNYFISTHTLMSTDQYIQYSVIIFNICVAKFTYSLILSSTNADQNLITKQQKRTDTKPLNLIFTRCPIVKTICEFSVSIRSTCVALDSIIVIIRCIRCKFSRPNVSEIFCFAVHLQIFHRPR